MDDPADWRKVENPQVHRVEMALSWVLRGGVLLSTAIVLTGLILMLAHHPEYLRLAWNDSNGPSAETVARELSFPHTAGEVFSGIVRGEGRSVIILGLFILIATPVARVAASVLIFLHQRDRAFTVITLIVLALLVASFVLGRGGG